MEVNRDNQNINVTVNEIFGTGVKSFTQTKLSEESHGENEVSVVLTNGATFTFKFYNGEKGEQGERGYGISKVQLNNDYTLTVTLENGLHFDTPSIRGEKGERGTGIQSVELREDYSLLFTLENGKTLETTTILGNELNNIRELEASAKKSADNAKLSEANSNASAKNASVSERNASEFSNSAETYATSSKTSAVNAAKSALAASTSEKAAATSETNSKASAEYAAQTKTEIEQLKKDTVEQTKTLTDSAKQEISTVKDATVSEVTQLKTDTISDITSIKDRAVEEVTVIKNDAKAEADKAKESETNAKLSETNASNSAKEAKASADSVANVVADVSKLKEDIGNKATAIIKKALGKTIVINDSSNLPIKTLSGTGKIIITGKNILDNASYGYNRFFPFKANADTIMTLITNGELSEGGNIKFIGEHDEEVWFAIDKGKTKVSMKIGSNVKGFYNLLTFREGLRYCLSVGENDEYEEYVAQVITAPVDSEQLKAIHTNYPTTVLTSENEISVEYVADTEAYIEKRIKEELNRLIKDE